MQCVWLEQGLRTKVKATSASKWNLCVVVIVIITVMTIVMIIIMKII